MLVNMSTIKDDVTSECNVSLFKDVKRTYWAAGYIQTAITQGWMFGYLNGSFKPSRGITLQEAVYAVIKLLGYSDSDFNGNKVNVIMKLYKTKGLNSNITKSKADYLTAKDCIYLFYNTLNATTKDGKVYASVLGYTLNSSQEIDYLSLLNTGISGPVIVDDNWKNKLPFSITEATMYKYGKQCSYLDIKDYDVIYYSENFKTIWIYDDKVTGTVESINPDYSNPSSVTVAGVNYSFADSEITLRFTAMGDVKEGDVVTLLLGKDGTVVDVLSTDEYNTTITGVVLALGTHLVETEAGKYVNTDYVTFVDASGNKHTQDYDGDTVSLIEGGLVKLSFVDGAATTTVYTQESRYFGNNTFSNDASTFGDLTLASNIKILDISSGNYISVYPERLAGVTLGTASIYYYELNSDGQLSQLILNDITGDTDSYGIYTGITFTGSNAANYNYLIGNKSGSLTANTLPALNYEIGPTQFVFKNNALNKSYALTGIDVTSIGTTTVQNNKMKFPLADNCYVYILLNGEYISTTIDKISDLSKYSVKAYYDKSITAGGRIRVIVAQSIN